MSILAFFGVPYVDRILAEWFRSDVDMRAQLVATPWKESLAGFLERDDKKGLAKYLAGITTDERLMAIVLCGEDSKPLLYNRSHSALKSVATVRRDIGARGSNIVKLADGSVEVSSFPMGSAERPPDQRRSSFMT